jgi:hypothetical protein
MPKRSSTSSSRDLNQNAARVAALATGDEAAPKRKRKNPAAVALGRKGGLKGGKARAASLSPSKRSEIARKAAKARWRECPTLPRDFALPTQDPESDD